jgi:UDP-N-acetylmuramoylalanine--D-glutamate ligase
MNYRNHRVTVMGLGQFGGGTAAARWLAAQGARVTVSDLADEATLSSALASLADSPITAFHLGGHREADFVDADLVVVNPAVKPDNPWLKAARQCGVPLTTEIDLFLQNCPAPTIGVTGSNGKSTTTAMIAAILHADGRRTWLGGNIGGSLLDVLDEIQSADDVVLELSSFQLTYLRPKTRVPHIGVITSFSPNHLDWHANLDEYAAAKRILFQRQQPGDAAVINTHDRRLVSMVSGTLRVPLADGIRGMPYTLPQLSVPGWHNRMNAACAATAALAAGCSLAAVEHGLANFRGLPLRMEAIADIGGRTFYNDSASTTPESTIVALESLDRPTFLIAGGRDKGFDITEMVEAIGRLTVGAALYGEVGPALCQRLKASHIDTAAIAVRTLEVAFDWCWDRSQPGDAIVLSPGCSSHDQFRNFRERGQRFTELVRRRAGGQ